MAFGVAAGRVAVAVIGFADRAGFVVGGAPTSPVVCLWLVAARVDRSACSRATPADFCKGVERQNCRAMVIATAGNELSRRPSSQ